MDPSVPTFNAGVTNHPAVSLGAGIQTNAIILAEQMLLSTEPPPQPPLIPVFNKLKEFYDLIEEDHFF